MSEYVKDIGIKWARIALALYAVLWFWGGLAWTSQSEFMAYILDETPKFTGLARDIANSLRDFQFQSWDIVYDALPGSSALSAILILTGVPDVYSFFLVQAALALALVWGCERVGTFLYGPRCGAICGAVALSLPILNSVIRVFTSDLLMGTALIWEYYAFLRLRAGGTWRYQLLFSAMLATLCNKGTGILYSLVMWAYFLVVLWRMAKKRGELSLSSWNRWEWFFSLSGVVLLCAALLFSLRVVSVLILVVVLLCLASVFRTHLRQFQQFITCNFLVLDVIVVYWWRWYCLGYIDDYLNITASPSYLPKNITVLDGIWRLFSDYADHLFNDALLPHIAVLLLLSLTVTIFCRRERPILEIALLVLLPGPLLNLALFNYIAMRYAATFAGAVAVVIGTVLFRMRSWARFTVVGGLVFFQLFMACGWMVSSSLPPANDNYLHADYFMCGRYHMAPCERHPEGAGLAWFIKLFNGHHNWADTYFCTLYPFRYSDVEKMSYLWKDWVKKDNLQGERFLICLYASQIECPFDSVVMRDPDNKNIFEGGSQPTVRSVCDPDTCKEWCAQTCHLYFSYLMLSLPLSPDASETRQRVLAEEASKLIGKEWELVHFSPSNHQECAVALFHNKVLDSTVPWRPDAQMKAAEIQDVLPVDVYYSDRRLRGKIPSIAVKIPTE